MPALQRGLASGPAGRSCGRRPGRGPQGRLSGLRTAHGLRRAAARPFHRAGESRLFQNDPFLLHGLTFGFPCELRTAGFGSASRCKAIGTKAELKTKTKLHVCTELRQRFCLQNREPVFCRHLEGSKTTATSNASEKCLIRFLNSQAMITL